MSVEANPAAFEVGRSAVSRSRAERLGVLPQLSIEQVSGAVWDDVVADFDEVCQEQLHAFAATRWPGVDLEAVVFRDGTGIVGGSMVMVQRLPLGLAGLAVVKWGPLLREANGPGSASIYAAMVEALVERYARERRLMLSIMPLPSVSAPNPRYAYLMERGFSEGSKLAFPDRYFVNLRLGDDDIRKSFGQKWRYHLNKSLKQGLTFEHAPAERMPEFDTLYRAMTDRKQFADHSAYDTLGGLMTLDNQRIRPELFFVRKDDRLVAGAVIFKGGDTSVYLYGATNDEALPLRAGYFLHWNIIRWLRDNTRACWYDLGGTDGFQGLHQFKKGMVGDQGRIEPTPPVANFATYRWPRLAGSAAFGLRDAFHSAKRRIEWMRSSAARPTQGRDA